MLVICLGIVNLMSLWMLVTGIVNTGHLQMNMDNWCVSLLTKSFYRMTVTSLSHRLVDIAQMKQRFQGLKAMY
ncbi:hypothetical protein D3C79_1087840 [compost metagenome]